MSSTMTERIKVDELSKFGFKVGQEYVNYSKKLSDAEKAKVVPGVELEAELFVADSGKRYLNKVFSVGIGAKAPVAVAPTVAVASERAKKFTPKYEKKDGAGSSATMSKDEWKAKDRSQLIGGLSHDAATVAVAVLNLDGSNEPGTESALRVYKTLLEGMLRIRDEVK